MKNSIILKSLTAVLLSLASVGMSSAQESKPAQKQKEVRFLFLQKHKLTPDTIHVQSKTKHDPLLISTRSPGEYHEIPATGKVTIGILETAETGEVLIPLATATIPENVTKTLALVVPTKEEKYFLVLIDENKFKPGSIFFYNNTNTDVGANIQKKKIKIKANTTSIFNPVAGEKSKNTYAAFYDLGIKPKATPKLITETTWNISPNRGEICIFYNDPIRNTVSMKILSSFYHDVIEPNE